MKRTLVACVAVLLLGGCFRWSSGLTPVQPPHGAVLTENRPLLSWEPGEEDADEVLYDLAVFDSGGRVVYQIDRLSETSHVLERALPPGRYRWTVRPLYRTGTQWKAGEWNGRRDFLFVGLYAQWGSGAYVFDIAEATQ
ncbi:MAG TPA: hypothetical protein VEC57_13350 [Candidatus Limnocylindrales bacterium]|nr:hypothetical protein [Candidatus Limnocylindrales bacterium]